MVLPLLAAPVLTPLLGMIGIGTAAGTGFGIFSRLKKKPTVTQSVTSTIKTVAIIGGVLVGAVLVVKNI